MYVHEPTYKTEKKIISIKEGIEEYKLRSQTVEAHNGTFKKCSSIYDNLPITRLKKSAKLDIYH